MTTQIETPVDAAADHSIAPSIQPSWMDQLHERTLPQFNQLVIWSLLVAATTLAVWQFELKTGPRTGFVSLLSWAPDSILRSSMVWLAFRGALIAGIALWATQCLLPWSCWLVVVSFTAIWSLHVETTSNTAHIFNMANMLLIIQAIWITTDAALIRSHLKNGSYWRTRLVPNWVSLAAITYIGMFHTGAGASKLFFSGPEWANGVSLQLWTYLWGRPWSPTTQLMLNSRDVTQGLQVLTLVFETAGILAIFPRLRTAIGWGLTAFYAGVLATFDYGFQFNALLTVMYFLPIERFVTPSASAQFEGNENKNTHMASELSDRNSAPSGT